MAMTSPFVTSLIPAFNAAATIRRAIDSALGQTYQNLEVVVVDDGSRDTTSEIAASYERDDVRLIRLSSNQGASGAVNEGIAAAKGEFIAFLDADDEWLPTKLAKQIAALQSNPRAVMATCGCRFVDGDGNVFREFGMPPPGIDKSEVWRSLLAATFIAKPCVVARTAALRAVGPFDIDLPVAEDQNMWIRLSMTGEVEFVPEYLTLVHDAPRSLTKVYADKVDKYVLPMIRRHISQQDARLSSEQVKAILGARYTSVGRNLYMTGSLVRGTALILRAMLLGDHVWENLWYLAAASPPAKAVKKIVRHPGAASREVISHPAPSAAGLLRPDKRDLVALPPRPPILIVMVDAEAEFDWDGPFLRTLVSVRNLEQQIIAHHVFDRLHVRPTYLVDYAVATQPEGYEPIRELLRSGRCEIGTHLQPWENPPFAEEPSVRTSFNHNLPAWLQKQKLERLTNAIVANFDVRPTTYRAGRYGVGDEIAWILASLGYQIDVSVLPGHDLRRRHGPDFRRAFNQPYWFGSDRELLEIPLTTGFAGMLARGDDPQMFDASVYTAISQPEATKWHLPGVFARLGLLERITLTPEGMSIQELKRLTRLLLRRGQRVFTFNYHSSSLLPGYTPYVRTRADLDRMIGTIDEYLHYFIEEVGGITMTPTEFRASLRPEPPSPMATQQSVGSLVQ
ncbi:MAG TPA: glycosyltransferase [Acetobacteraceae bacterium]|nr:glycosyltransferase [Acetobacteraceae bacterium]